MSQSFDVCIRGDGVVGRSLALSLAQQRLRVALVVAPDRPSHDKSPLASGHPPADVRAYALNVASKRLLESLRAWPDATGATPVLDMQVWDADEAHGARLDFSASGSEQAALAWIADVPVLEQQLGEAVRYQALIQSVGEPVKASLQVICEGQSSRSRQALATDWRVKPYLQKAIAARLESSQPHRGLARQWFSGGEVLALLPMGGAQGNSIALVWSVSVERATVLEAMDDEAFCAALQSSCLSLAGDLKLVSRRTSWPLALSQADRWVGPGWVLAGDAAHTVHPLAGQGLNLGLADVSALSEVIAKREYWRTLGDEKLLRRYERMRRTDVAAMGLVTDGLHGLFSQTDARWQALRHWGMRGFAQSGWLKSWVTRRASGL